MRAAAQKLPWYALQVTAGRESAVARRVRAIAGEAVHDCFSVRRQAFFRLKGVWELQEQHLFPGYVIAITQDTSTLAEALGLLADEPVRPLVNDAGEPIALDAPTVALLSELAGPNHLIAASEGAIVDGRLVVYSGPLAGREDLVTKIDRHKRVAYLDMSLLGRSSVRMALEVVAKS